MTTDPVAHHLALEVARTTCLVRSHSAPFLAEIAERYAPFTSPLLIGEPDLQFDLHIIEPPVRTSWEPRFVTHPGLSPLPVPEDYDPVRDGPVVPYEVSITGSALRVAAGNILRGELDLATRRANVLQTRSIYLFHTILRQSMAYVLPLRGDCMLHSSGVVLGDHAVGFFGPSGSGKSTIARLAPGPVLTDESLALTHEAGSWKAHATPFWGDYDAGPPAITSAPLAALFRLAQGEEDVAIRLPWHLAVRELTSSLMYRLDSPEYESALVARACTLAAKVPCFTLTFRPTANVWETITRSLALVM